MKLLIDASALIPIYPNVLQDRSIGGTETAVIKISNELAAIGVEVDILTASEHTFKGNPSYLSHRESIEYQKYFACIVVQNWRVIPFLPSIKIILWTGDGAEQFSNLGIGDLRLQKRILGLFVASNFHKLSLCQSSGYPLDKTMVIGNGVSDGFYANGNEVKSGMIYHSAPYRGLEHLLRYVSEINLDYPLSVYSDMDLYKREDYYRGPHADLLPKLTKKYSNLKTVTFNKTIPQPELSKKLLSSSVFPYPCVVPEVFCMSMLEAMAAGVVPLVSEIGGLAEILGDRDLVVSGLPGTKEFDLEFKKRLIFLIQNDQFRSMKSKLVAERAQNNFKWSDLALKFKKSIEEVCI